MRDKDRLHAAVQKSAHNLLCDFRALSLVGGSEGFVEEDHGIRIEHAGQCAHPAELLVEFSARHTVVFLALVVREDAAHDIGLEFVRPHEQTRLHHELGNADASQEGRFATLIGARSDNQVLSMRFDVVADNVLVHADR